MVTESTLEEIRGYSVIVNCHSDHRFIETMNRELTNIELHILSHQLSIVPIPHDFRWKSSDWYSYFSDDYQVLILLIYEADTAWGPVSLMREIELSEGCLVANHSYLKIPDELQGRGISKAINRILYKQYRLCGVRTIRVRAALTAGGYVWALAGFCATDQKEVQTILDSARKKAEKNEAEGSASTLTQARCDLLQKRVALHYSLTPHKHFPMGVFAEMDCGEEILMETEWSGEIDLADLSQYSIFEEHLNK